MRQKSVVKDVVIREVDDFLLDEQVEILGSIITMQDELKHAKALKNFYFFDLANQLEKAIRWLLELNELCQLARAELQKERYDLAIAIVSAKITIAPVNLENELKRLRQGLLFLQGTELNLVEKPIKGRHLHFI